MKMPHNMSRKQLEEYKIMEELDQNPEKITLDHPLVKREYESQMEDLKALESEKVKIMEKLQKYKSKKILDKIQQVVNDGQEEWKNIHLLK